MTPRPRLQALRRPWNLVPQCAYSQPGNRGHKLEAISALEYPRLTHDAVPMRIPAFRQRYANVKQSETAPDEISLYGRLRCIRRTGSKLFFLSLSSEFNHIQALCNFRKLQSETPDAFKRLSRALNRGDILTVTGRATRTPTGELTLEATRLPRLLVPTLVPLPARITSSTTRRHMDMLVSQSSTDTLRMRAHIMRFLRDALHEDGFIELQTPILARRAGGAVARPFVTRATEFPDKALSLRVAPELWLKRLVVGGIDRVFEMGPVFRNEGIDTSHNPEFTMCEFYAAYQNLDDLMDRTEMIIRGLARSCASMVEKTLTSLPAVHAEKYKPAFRRLPFIPTLEAALTFPLPDLASPMALSSLSSLLQSHSILLPPESFSSLAHLLDRLASHFIETHSHNTPVFITHHPSCMSPLSKSFTCPLTNQDVSARAELFVDGREIANMYEEENDPVEQGRKFGDRVDETYIAALESGLPPTGGWGAGIERLCMLFAGAGRIADCLTFGTVRNVVGLEGGRVIEYEKGGDE